MSASAPDNAFAAEMTLLRAGVRHGVPDSPQEPLAPLCRAVNWTHVLWLGRQVRALVLLEAALQQARSDGCPADVLEQLAQFRAVNQLQTLTRNRELCLLHDLFQRNDIPVLAASSAAFAQRHHSRPALREVAPESHYFVRRADRARATAVLREAGYNMELDSLALTHRERTHVVLHSRLGTGPGSDTAFWDKAEAFSYQGRTLRTLSLAHWLIHLCWYNSQRLWPDFRGVFDVAALSHSRNDAEWEDILREAVSRGREAALLLGVTFCHRLLGLAIPLPLARRLQRNASLLQQIDDRERSMLTGHQVSPTPLAFLRAHLALQPTLIHKVRCAWRHAPLLASSVRSHALAATGESGSIGLFAPTPPNVVTAMLRLAEAGPTDVVCDAGCGDGRVVIAAVEQFGARGIGIDLDPQRVAEARSAAEALKISDRVQWQCGDFLQTDVSGATILFLYLQGFSYSAIRQKLQRELPRGTRIVSHDFYFPGWPPEKTALVRGSNARISQIYLWRLP